MNEHYALTLNDHDYEAFPLDTINLIAIWARWVELNYREETYDTYTVELDYFNRWLEIQGLDCRDVRPGDIHRWVIDTGPALRETTMSGRLACVRNFYRWMVANEVVEGDPTASIKLPRTEGFFKPPLSRDRKIMTKEQVRQIFATCGDDFGGRRDEAILALMAMNGLRRIELYRAEVSDIRPEGDRTVLWVWGKGRDHKDQFAVLMPFTYSKIKRWLEVRGDWEGPLFTRVSRFRRTDRLPPDAISHAVKVRMIAAGVGDRSAHSLRHTFVTHLILSGVPPQRVQKAARHADINTTLAYYHELDRLEDPAESHIDYGL